MEGRGRERKQQKRHRRNKILNFSGGDLLIERDTEGDMSKHSQHLDCDYGHSRYVSLGTRKVVPKEVILVLAIIVCR